ncbi:Cullin repeat-like-containing domain protein [Mycena floridula]|nr:Cullin repeat-like-containing domain protein [Mycena floridula]
MARQPSPPVSPKESWDRILPSIDQCMTTPEVPLTALAYSDAYTIIYKCVKATKITPGEDISNLYDLLEKWLVSHAQGRHETLFVSSNDSLLHSYNAEFERFKSSMRKVNNMLGYLNRGWIQRIRDEKETARPKKPERRNLDDTADVFPVYTLGILTWKTTVFLPLQPQITTLILDQIQRDRDDQPVDKKLLKDVVTSYISLGLNNEHLTVPVLDVYWEYLETPFFEATVAYYGSKTPATVDLDRVIQVEIGRDYLDPSTLQSLKAKLLEMIIHNDS